MPRYAYRAKRGPKEIIDGVIEAANETVAVDRLSDQGLVPLSLTETKAEVTVVVPDAAQASRAPEPPVITKKRLFGRVRSSEVTIFTRQLASLLKAGVPILRGLEIISVQSENPALRKLLSQLQERVRDGEPLSAVMARTPKLFPPIYLAMVRTGEDSGTLPETLLRIAEYRQRQEEIASRVRTAMAYPILMAFVGVGTVVFMFTFVIPRLSGLFGNLGQRLPLPTRILMTISHGFQNPMLWAVLGGLTALVLLIVRFQNKRVLALWSRLSLHMPVIGGFVMKAEMARFSRTLELLLVSGVPILRSIEITAPVLANDLLAREIRRVHQDLIGGSSFGKSLAKSKEFPLFLTNLVSVGEESGKLDEAMGEIARFYERETDEAIKVMTSLLEPVMILVMGLVVGFIVIAMLLPMFELSLAIK